MNQDRVATADVGGLGEASWCQPSPRLRTLRRVEWLIVVGTLTAAAAAVAIALAPPVLAAVAVVAGAAGVLAWRIPARQWAAWGYAERADDLLVRRGILVRRLSVVPYGRMQFVDVTAGPVDRRLGLATVHLHTAAAASDARIPGLVAAEAARLRDRLAALGESRAAGL